jgi:hypothetical protein
MADSSRSAQPGQRDRRTVGTGGVFVITGTLLLALSGCVLVATESSISTPSPTPHTAKVRLDKPSLPVRIRVPAAGIDLPVVSSDRKVRGNPPGATPCDVALRWTKYDRPGEPGTTWIYGHAQAGMFLPLFEISERTAGKGLIGKVAELQLRDGRLLTYRITEVRERAQREGIAVQGRKRKEQRLVLQTSTGPKGTKPKLLVAAKLIDAEKTTEKAPKARPRACWRPA